MKFKNILLSSVILSIFFLQGCEKNRGTLKQPPVLEKKIETALIFEEGLFGMDKNKVEKLEQKCKQKGGERLKTYGINHGYRCEKKYTDANKSCNSSLECIGSCVLNEPDQDYELCKYEENLETGDYEYNCPKKLTGICETWPQECEKDISIEKGIPTHGRINDEDYSMCYTL